MSKRNHDINGWYEVKDNPLSKVGVYQYSGAMIDPTGELGLDANKAYNVMRPKEELSNPETIDSFKLVPWINDHVMLGDGKDGLTPPERKGVSGVIGENVYFDNDDMTLKGNVKVFAEDLRNEIDEGKKELSLGYRCKYEKKSGVYDGQGYDFVQKCIRGNHLASVDEGRMGSEVAVLDGNLLTFTIDSKELTKMDPEKKKAEDEAKKKAEDEAKKKAEDEKKAKDEAEVKKKAEDEKKAKDEAEAKKKAEDEKKYSDKEGMDSLKSENENLKETVVVLTDTVDGLKSTVESLKKDGFKTVMVEVGKRDALAENLSQHIGTFDHAEMTLDEVAKYGIEKLELQCDEGFELATLNGYLHGRTPAVTGHGLDSKESGGSMSGLDGYLNGNE